MKKDVDYKLIDLGEYKKVEVKNQKDRTYYIMETDRELKTYNLLVVLKSPESHFQFKIINANIGLTPGTLDEDEKYIFPNGRTRSKYLNAIIVFNYFRLGEIDYTSEIANSIGEMFSILSRLTGVSCKALSEGSYDLASYFGDLYEAVELGANVFKDENFEKGEMNSRKSNRFFLNTLYIYDKSNFVNSIEWDSKEDKLLIQITYRNGDRYILSGYS